MNDRPPALPPHRSRAVRALVILHDRHLRVFLDTWARAQAAGVTLPATKDPAYASLDALLFHVLGCARGYLTWMCEKLALPDPRIAPTPPADRIAPLAREVVDRLRDGWASALAEVPDERLEDQVFPSRWGVPYSIDAMLEHAVMHPIRHAFQLEELLAGQAR